MDDLDDFEIDIDIPVVADLEDSEIPVPASVLSSNKRARSDEVAVEDPKQRHPDVAATTFPLEIPTYHSSSANSTSIALEHSKNLQSILDEVYTPSFNIYDDQGSRIFKTRIRPGLEKFKLSLEEEARPLSWPGLTWYTGILYDHHIAESHFSNIGFVKLCHHTGERVNFPSQHIPGELQESWPTGTFIRFPPGIHVGQAKGVFSKSRSSPEIDPSSWKRILIPIFEQSPTSTYDSPIAAQARFARYILTHSEGRKHILTLVLDNSKMTARIFYHKLVDPHSANSSTNEVEIDSTSSAELFLLGHSEAERIDPQPSTRTQPESLSMDTKNETADEEEINNALQNGSEGESSQAKAVGRRAGDGGASKVKKAGEGNTKASDRESKVISGESVEGNQEKHHTEERTDYNEALTGLHRLLWRIAVTRPEIFGV